MPSKVEPEILLDEIARRVIEIDAERKADDELKLKIAAYVEALDELTELDKPEIELIAQQVVSDYSGVPVPSANQMPVRLPLSISLLGISVLVLAVFAGKYFGLKEGVERLYPSEADTPTENTRSTYVRRHLTEALQSLSSLKIYYLEHCQVTGRCPATLEETGLNPVHFIDGKLVKRLNFNASGAIEIDLGAYFEPGSKVLWQSDVLELKEKIRWVCYTNIGQELLGSKEVAPCQYKSDLEL